MITKFLLSNGGTAFFLENETDEDGNPMVVYIRKSYPILTERATERGYIQVGKNQLLIIGSIDRIAGKFVTLYWRHQDEHDIAAAAAELMLKDYPDCGLLSFGCHIGIVFSQDSEGFKVVEPQGADEFSGTLEEVIDFIDKHY